MFQEEMVNSSGNVYFLYCNKKGEVKQYSIIIRSYGDDWFDGIDIESHSFKRFIKCRVIKTYINHNELIDNYGDVDKYEDYIPRLGDYPDYEIHFTGFESRPKQKLEKQASEHGFIVRTDITKNLQFLCVGHKTDINTLKFKKANEYNIPMITEKQFLDLIETGEVPLPEPGEFVVTQAIQDNEIKIYNEMVEEFQLNFKTIRTSRRISALLAIFQDGYAAGWRFAVNKAHSEQLDIKYTSIQRNLQKTNIWTQGDNFNFRRGSVFYSNRLAYDDLDSFIQLEDAISLQVKYDCLSGYESIATVNGYISGEYTPLKVSGTRKLSDTPIEMELQRYDRGDITIEVYKSNKKKLVMVTELTMPQDEFIYLLQTGKFISKAIDSQQISLIDIFDYIKAYS